MSHVAAFRGCADDARTSRKEILMQPCKQDRDPCSFDRIEVAADAGNDERPSGVRLIMPEMTPRMSPPKQSLPGDSARLSYMSE